MSADTDAPSSISRRSPPRLSGLEIFMRDDRSPLYRHGIVAKVVASYIGAAGEILLVLAQPAGLRRDLQDLARRKRLSGLPERARARERPPPGQPAAGLDPRGRRDPQRDGGLHPAPQGVPGGAADADGRAALSGGRQGRQRLQPVHAGRDGQGVGQPEDLPALLPRPLGDVRRQRQPAADLHGDGRGFLRSDGRAAGRAGRQAQRQGRHPAAGRRAAQSRSLPTASTISPRRTRPIRCRRRRSPSISTRISRRCIPSSCAASCSGRSIRPASPRTIRR